MLRLYDPEEVAETLRRAGLEADVSEDYPGVTTDLPPIPGWKVVLGRKPPV